jgi:hypothetical protein
MLHPGALCESCALRHGEGLVAPPSFFLLLHRSQDTASRELAVVPHPATAQGHIDQHAYLSSLHILIVRASALERVEVCVLLVAMRTCSGLRSDHCPNSSFSQALLLVCCILRQPLVVHRQHAQLLLLLLGQLLLQALDLHRSGNHGPKEIRVRVRLATSTQAHSHLVRPR